jgi:hypothetical protein
MEYPRILVVGELPSSDPVLGSSQPKINKAMIMRRLCRCKRLVFIRGKVQVLAET